MKTFENDLKERHSYLLLWFTQLISGFGSVMAVLPALALSKSSETALGTVNAVTGLTCWREACWHPFCPPQEKGSKPSGIV